MSIEKLDFKKVTKENIPYTLVNTKVIQKIKDPLAGYVWIYLSSLPPDWRVCKQQLMKHFNVGIGRMKQIFSFLKKSNLIEYKQIKDEKGIYGEFIINVLCGDEFINISGGMETVPPEDLTGGTVCRPAASRSNGKQHTTKENKKQNALSSTKSTKSSLDKTEKSKSVDNSKRHDFADSMDQEACYKKNVKTHEERKAEEMKMKRTNGIVKL